MNTYCKRIFWDLNREVPAALEEAFDVICFDEGTKGSWREINSYVSRAGNPQAMAQMLCFEEDAILVSSIDSSLILASDIGVAVLGVEEESRILEPQLQYLALSPEAVTPRFVEMVYRRHHGYPLEIARTDNLILRETVSKDLEELTQIYEDAECAKYLPQMGDLTEEKKKLTAYSEHVYALFGYGMWTILDPDGKEVLGKVGFENEEWNGQSYPFLGYVIKAKHRRKGLAKEAILEAMSYLKEETDVSQVMCKIHPQNLASLQLAQAMGFEKISQDENVVYLSCSLT